MQCIWKRSLRYLQEIILFDNTLNKNYAIRNNKLQGISEIHL
jgi:hypothetical protein